MNIKWCPHCGKKNEYTVTVPKFCTSCGKEMSFKVNVNSVQAFTNDDEEASANKNRPRPITPALRRPAPNFTPNNTPEPVSNEDDEYYDRDAAKAYASELVRTIDMSQFEFGVANNTSVKGSELFGHLAEQIKKEQPKKSTARKSKAAKTKNT